MQRHQFLSSILGVKTQILKALSILTNPDFHAKVIMVFQGIKDGGQRIKPDEERKNL